MAVISIGITVIFVAIAITSLYISYLCRDSYILLGNKIIDLEESLKKRLEEGDHVEFTVSQAWFMKKVLTESEGDVKNRFRDFFNTGTGRYIVLSGVLVSSGLGIVIGLGLSLYNQESALQIGLFPLIVIITYVFLVLLSEVIATIKFSRDMSTVDCKRLGKKDLKIFKRASHILNTRKRQFIIIAGLLVLYGLLSEIMALIVVGIFVIIEMLFIGVLSPFLHDYFIVVFIAGAFIAVLISIIIAKIYVSFCKLLMRIDFSEFQ